MPNDILVSTAMAADILLKATLKSGVIGESFSDVFERPEIVAQLLLSKVTDKLINEHGVVL